MRFFARSAISFGQGVEKFPPSPARFNSLLASVRLTARQITSVLRKAVHYKGVYNCDNKSPNSNLLFFQNTSLCTCAQMYMIRYSGRQARRLSSEHTFHGKFVPTHRSEQTLVPTRNFALHRIM